MGLRGKQDDSTRSAEGDAGPLRGAVQVGERAPRQGDGDRAGGGVDEGEAVLVGALVGTLHEPHGAAWGAYPGGVFAAPEVAAGQLLILLRADEIEPFRVFLTHEVRGKPPLESSVVVRHGLVDGHVSFALLLDVFDEVNEVEPVLAREVTVAAAGEAAFVEDAVDVGDDAEQSGVIQWTSVILEIRDQSQRVRQGVNPVAECCCPGDEVFVGLRVAGSAGVKLLPLAVLVDAAATPAAGGEFISGDGVVALSGCLGGVGLNLPVDHCRVRNVERHVGGSAEVGGCDPVALVEYPVWVDVLPIGKIVGGIGIVGPWNVIAQRDIGVARCSVGADGLFGTPDEHAVRCRLGDVLHLAVEGLEVVDTVVGIFPGDGVRPACRRRRRAAGRCAVASTTATVGEGKQHYQSDT